MHYSYLMQEPSEFDNPRQRDKKAFGFKIYFLTFSQTDKSSSFGDPWNKGRLRLLDKAIFEDRELFVNSEIFWIWWSEISIFRQRFVFSIVPAWAHFIRFGMNAIKVTRKSRPKRANSQIRKATNKLSLLFIPCLYFYIGYLFWNFLITCIVHSGLPLDTDHDDWGWKRNYYVIGYVKWRSPSIISGSKYPETII